jgi:hypothetical protein
MEYQWYTCRHCAYETASRELMQQHQDANHQKPEVPANAS